MPWHDNGVTPPKDKRMDMTQENFYRVIAMRDELIFEQKEEISKLKRALNNLELKLQKKKRIISDINNKARQDI